MNTWASASEDSRGSSLYSSARSHRVGNRRDYWRLASVDSQRSSPTDLTYPNFAGDFANLAFGRDELMIRLSDGAWFSVPYLELASIEISGPGTVFSGGGFIGGGFWVTSALEGMAVATVLNALTTKSKIHTFLSLTTNIGELHFHYGAMERGALRIGLASVHATLRTQNPAWRQERVATLQFARAQGTLSEPEVARILNRLSEPIKVVSNPPPAEPKSLPPPPIIGPKGRCPNCAAIVPLHTD